MLESPAVFKFGSVSCSCFTNPQAAEARDLVCDHFHISILGPPHGCPLALFLSSGMRTWEISS